MPMAHRTKIMTTGPTPRLVVRMTMVPSMRMATAMRAMKMAVRNMITITTMQMRKRPWRKALQPMRMTKKRACSDWMQSAPKRRG